MEFDKQKSLTIKLLHWFSVLIAVFMLFLLTVSYINGANFNTLFVFFISSMIMFFSTYLIKKKQYNFAKFILSIVPAYTIFFVSIISKSNHVFANFYTYLIPRFTSIIYLMVPVIFFGLRQYKKMIISVGFISITIFFFDFFHHLAGVNINEFIQKNIFFYFFIFLFAIFYGLTILAVLFFQKSNFLFREKLKLQNKKIIEDKEKTAILNIKLKRINEEYDATNEELTQNNEELLSLNENLEKHKDLLELKQNDLFKLNIKLSESENKYRILFEKSEDAILIIYNEKFIDCNTSTLKMLGYTNKQDFLNMQLTDSFPKKQPDGQLSDVKAKKELSIAFEKGSNKFEWIYLKANGKEFPVEVLLTAIPYQNRTIIHTVLRDITQRKINEQQIKQKNEQLETFTVQLSQNIRKLRKKNKQIEKAHIDILDNIRYAKKIQESLLTSDKLLNNYFSEYFLLFKPKDQVSGDFYYVVKHNDYLIIAVADCTGHGVTGGFITVLGITYLHEIVSNVNTNNPGKVLNTLRKKIKNTFMSFGSESDNGMDIALCIINTNTNVLTYSGAFNPLWIVRNDELIEYKATRNPIAFYPIEKDFENSEIKLQDNDLLYLFSDGYQDQIDYKTGKKITRKDFKNKILEVSREDLYMQKELLDNDLQKRIGDSGQVDDVTVLGIKWKNTKKI